MAATTFLYTFRERRRGVLEGGNFDGLVAISLHGVDELDLERFSCPGNYLDTIRTQI